MLKSNQNITWCPGCTNFFILNSFVNALEELEKEKLIEITELIIKSEYFSDWVKKLALEKRERYGNSSFRR